MDAQTVAERLGLDPGYRDWLAELDALGPAAQPVPVPVAPPAGELALSERDAADLAGARPDSPEWRWLFDRCYHRLIRYEIGTPPLDDWPALPEPLGPVGACFYGYVLLAGLDRARAWHRRHNISAELSRDTLGALGRAMAGYRREHGRPGVAMSGWLALHLRGRVYELGRLQYTPFRIDADRAEPPDWDWADRRPGFRVGDPVLGLHIPSGSPLSPAACDESLRRAPTAFADYYPGEPSRLAVCTSWLLDDQLLEYLPEESNIVRFHRRFTLVPGEIDGDGEVMRFVFDRATCPPEELPRRTTLERAIADHLIGGRHWRMRTGYFVIGGRSTP